MNDKHKEINTFKLIVTACLFLVLSACSNDDNTVTTSETITELPQFIQNIAESHIGSGVLEAEISFNGSDGSFEKMEIDSADHKSTIKKVLSKKEYTIVIRFMYTIGTKTILLCTSDEVKIDLSKGDENITLGENNYTCKDEIIDDQGPDTPKLYDDDNDGISNRKEIVDGTDPFVFDKSSKTIANLNITPNDTTVTVGLTQPLTATVIYSDFTTQNFTKIVDWSSGDESVATVSSDGLVTGVTAGTTSINARLTDSGTQASITIEIVAAVNKTCILDGTSKLDDCKLE